MQIQSKIGLSRMDEDNSILSPLTNINTILQQMNRRAINRTKRKHQITSVRSIQHSKLNTQTKSKQTWHIHIQNEKNCNSSLKIAGEREGNDLTSRPEVKTCQVFNTAHQVQDATKIKFSMRSVLQHRNTQNKVRIPIPKATQKNQIFTNR